MTSNQTYWWRVGLELKLRQLSGTAFQDFFAELMLAAHGDSYVRVRPYGQLGDKGCDGYLASSGRVHACYGAINGDKDKVGYLISKMSDDFTKAKTHLGTIMKEWVMTHNLVDGLPIEAILKLEELKKAEPNISFGFATMESLANVLLSLPQEKIERLVGPAATAADTHNMDALELKGLIDAVMSEVDTRTAPPEEIKKVSPEKLSHNKLPEHWRQLLTLGMQNAGYVSQYFEKHHDALIGEKVAERFRIRYANLRQQNLEPPAVMTELFRFIVGDGLPPPAKTVAAQALLAHLFESCDVLEDAPDAVAV